MFSPDLPRALVSLLFSLAILAGCAVQQPQQIAADNTADVALYITLKEWLDLQQKVAEMGTAEVTEQLGKVDKSASSGQMYYFGVLNQQLKTYGAWTVARDAFQKLQENQVLPREQRQLAGILRQYNQNRINGYAKQRMLAKERTQLQQDLSRAEDEKRQLAQKIQALTELEAAISTRKEE